MSQCLSWDHGKEASTYLNFTFRSDACQFFMLVSLPYSVLEILQAKGAGKNGRFQGKANSLARRAEVDALLQQHCKCQMSGEE